MSDKNKLKEDLISVMGDVNLIDDPIMKPLSLALCVRLKNKLPQISFSKEASDKVETIEIPFKFNINGLSVAVKDLISNILEIISDECIEKFKSYKPFTVNFCGIYKADDDFNVKVVFKINK